SAQSLTAGGGHNGANGSTQERAKPSELPGGIARSRGRIGNVSIHIAVTSTKSSWVLTDESAGRGIIISCSRILLPKQLIPFAGREFEPVAIRRRRFVQNLPEAVVVDVVEQRAVGADDLADRADVVAEVPV